MTFEEILKEPLPSKMIDDDLYVCEMPERDINLSGKAGNCKVIMWGKEGKNIPHFHIKSKSKKFNVAICLDKAMYFKHGIYINELNIRQKKKLQKCLETKCLDGNTLWEIFVNHWNDSEEGMKNKVLLKNIPDYTKMTESIVER